MRPSQAASHTQDTIHWRRLRRHLWGVVAIVFAFRLLDAALFDGRQADILPELACIALVAWLASEAFQPVPRRMVQPRRSHTHQQTYQNLERE